MGLMTLRIVERMMPTFEVRVRGGAKRVKISDRCRPDGQGKPTPLPTQDIYEDDGERHEFTVLPSGGDDGDIVFEAKFLGPSVPEYREIENYRYPVDGAIYVVEDSDLPAVRSKPRRPSP